MPEPNDQRTLCLDCEHRADMELVIEALVQLAGPEVETPRDRRAWELIDMLADDLGVTPSELYQSTSIQPLPADFSRDSNRQ